IRVADDEGKVDSSALVTAIESVAELKSEWEKVDIIVLDSLIVGRMGSVYSKAEQEAINKAVKAGISVIVGAGDEGSNAKSYPASYDGVISVGAVNRDNSVAAFSNKGTPVDIYAPGVDMASTGLNGSYFKRSSTSVAASVTAGVAALYMSVNGHVSPDKMKNALLEARNMSGEIGVISAAKIFKGDTRAPEVVLNDGYGNISGSFFGEDKKSNPTVPGDGYITIKSRNFAGKEGSTGNAVLVYSLDGTAPKVENGELTHGEIFDGTISYNGTIIKDGKTSKKTVTIIAAAITGIGVMSKMTTVTFTIDPKAVSKPLSLRICGVSDDVDNPSSIPLGYSIQLRAESSGVDTKTIKWSIKHAEGVSASINSVSANINGSTAYLSTSGGGKKDGYVTVSCKATSPKEIEQIVEIKVLAGVDPVGKITLNTKNEELWYNEENAGSYELVIQTYEDINGRNIRYNEFGIDWISSNEEVAIVEPYNEEDADEPDKNGWKKATIIAKGAGKCTITCAPMDGSGKTAKVSVTVRRSVDGFKIDGPQQVLRGKTYQLKATAFVPEESATSDVKWLTVSDCDKVTLDPNTGKLTIGKKAEVGDTFTVVATAHGCMSEPFDIEIVKGSCKKLIAQPKDGFDKTYYQIKTKKNGSLKSINLFIKNPDAIKNVSENSTMIRVEAIGYNKDDDDLDLDTIFSSSDPKIVSVTTGPDGDVTLKAVKKGTATITCIYSDSSRKKTTFTVKVTDPVESIKVSGQSAIVVGKSAQFKAKQVLPETAGNKKVTWSISDNVTGVRISKSGKLKLESTPSVNTVTVVATAADGSGVTGSMDFVVCAAKTKSLVLNTTADPEVYKIKRAKKTDKLQQARLYTVNIPKNGNAENKLTLNTNSAYALDWKSSDTSVAKVEAADGGKGAVVTAVAKGTATITCKALDGSKKKATMKIVVQVPASGVSLIPQDEQSGDIHFLAYGKSVDITASLGRSFGTPTGSKIKWYYEFCNVSVERDDDGNVESIDVEAIEYDQKELEKVFGFKSVDGKLTMPAYEIVKNSGVIESDDEREQFIFAITVTAVADEGLGYYASKTFVACHPVKSMSLCYKDIYYNNGDTMAIGVGESTSYEMKGNYGGKGGEYTRLVGGVSVKSSDPAIMSAYYDERQGRLVITGHKKGSVKVTIAAKDGSETKMELKVKVNK
ncbi:MAG: S8 family serine peptidase, partial [Lachnospiraceae bacterium]|nr:S8 family serine peptidase [Lachnospiraceae bacterium]